MVPSSELHELALPDGGRIVAAVSYPTGMRVARFDAASHEVARIDLDYPSNGYGGGGWVLSPSGRLLILNYYSGQSEEAFILLDLASGGLRMVASPGYELGEYSSYAFTPDEDKMIVALPWSCSDWWAQWEDDELEVADDGVKFLPFATLFVCSTDSGQMQRTELHVVPTVPEPIHKEKYDPDLNPRLSADLDLAIQLPWAFVKIDLSNAPARVRVPYPAQSD